MTTEAVSAPQVVADTTEKPNSAAVGTPASTATTPPKPVKPTTTPSKSTPKKSTAAQEESSRSPDSSGKRNELPKIIVKKEPSSPEPPSRHRPPKLHLSNAPPAAAGAAVTPRTANGNLATMQDVGMACLSPGFSTQDPAMREQLQRSISVRDHQRSIIESRLQRHAKQGSDRNNAEPSSKADRDESTSARDRGAGERSTNTPRRRPPNSLTIVPPPHTAFAHERIVQSAPLNQSFTGRHQPHPSSNIPHHPPHQQAPRLPPITDVFANERLDSSRSRPVDTSTAANRQYFPSVRPSYPSPNTLAYPRPREHRSAEEALASLSGGREDLIPRIIHYGGHQPPTPPSPTSHTTHTPSKLQVNNNNGPEHAPHSGGGRRRNRAEYERDGSYGCEGGDSPDAKRRKKEEFLALCARAWELFHS